ncbi:MAG: hypothetical protein ACXVEF_26455 [Polyangiales bacterium]
MKRYALVFAFVSHAVILGCGSPAQPAAPSAPVVKAPPKPARPGKSAILFVVDYEALLPVACFDHHKGEWKNGEACFAMLPDDPQIELEDKRVVKAGGWRVPTITNCTLSTPLLMFEGAASEKPGTLAVWPAGRRVDRVEWPSGKVASVAPDAQARLGAAMGKIGGGSTVKVVQVTHADLDADGADDDLFSATTGGFDPASSKGMAALFYAPTGGDPIAIRSSDHAVFRVEALTDLDDDGLPEVFASERTFHPNGRKSDAMTIAHWTPGGMSPLAPLESCWPPAKIK